MATAATELHTCDRHVADHQSDDIGLLTSGAIAHSVAYQRGLPVDARHSRRVEVIDGPVTIERWIVCDLDDGVSVEVYLPEGHTSAATVGLWDHARGLRPDGHPLAELADV